MDDHIGCDLAVHGILLDIHVILVGVHSKPFWMTTHILWATIVRCIGRPHTLRGLPRLRIVDDHHVSSLTLWTATHELWKPTFLRWMPTLTRWTTTRCRLAPRQHTWMRNATDGRSRNSRGRPMKGGLNAHTPAVGQPKLTLWTSTAIGHVFDVDGQSSAHPRQVFGHPQIRRLVSWTATFQTWPDLGICGKPHAFSGQPKLATLSMWVCTLQAWQRSARFKRGQVYVIRTHAIYVGARTHRMVARVIFYVCPHVRGQKFNPLLQRGLRKRWEPNLRSFATLKGSKNGLAEGFGLFRLSFAEHCLCILAAKFCGLQDS